MKKYIVTGYKGFIGKNLIKSLPQFIGFEKEDIYLDEHIEKCDGIFHLGACADLRNSDINDMFFNNVKRSFQLFKKAKYFNKKVVFSSSSAVYGNNNEPTNSYSWSKYCSEKIGKELLGSNFVALRFFNVYGPGESHKGLMSSIPYQIYHSNRFGIFPRKGKDNSLISPARDFVHVDDVVKACLIAMKNKINGIYDIGTCQPVAYNEICSIMGKEFYYFDLKEKPSGYQDYTCADSKKILPGWIPVHPNVGIKKYKGYLDAK